MPRSQRPPFHTLRMIGHSFGVVLYASTLFTQHRLLCSRVLLPGCTVWFSPAPAKPLPAKMAYSS